MGTHKTEVSPERTLDTTIDGKAYRWESFSPASTGLRLVALEDRDTGARLVVTQGSPGHRLAAHRAWGGARHSRAPGETEEIFAEMGLRGVDPDAKLEETFANYGHKSVGDMARFEVHINRVPGHVPFLFFHLGRINSGQEKSTRYQSQFTGATLAPLAQYLDDEQATPDAIAALDKEYQRIGMEARAFTQHFLPAVIDAFNRFYMPQETQRGSLASRALDTTRGAFLLGARTGFVYETSARDWATKIAHLKGMHLPAYRRLGDQLELLLAPPREIEDAIEYTAEAPALLRHTDANRTVAQNLEQVREYLRRAPALPREPPRVGVHDQEVTLVPQRYTPAQRMAAQYVLAVRPDTDPMQALVWVAGLPDRLQRELSAIITAGHTHHNELPQLAETTGSTAILETGLGEIRDFNRHRAYARFLQGHPWIWGAPLPSDDAQALLAQGAVLPLYLTEIPAFRGLRNTLEGFLTRHYEQVDTLRETYAREFGTAADQGFLINLLPLAHRARFWMHGNPKQDQYLTALRVRDGGHINYRALAYDWSLRCAAQEPLLCSFALNTTRPDPASRDEFFSRK